MKILSVKNLEAHYITEVYGLNRTVKAVNNVSLDVFENEVYGIAGESGCGKTTLIKILTATNKPPLKILKGNVVYDPLNKKIDILKYNNNFDKDLKWKYMSYIPQGSMNVLNPLQKIKKTFYQFIKAHSDYLNKDKLNKMISDHFINLGLNPTV